VGETFESLSNDLKAAFRGGVLHAWTERRFDELAHRVLQYQLEANPVYSTYCRRRGFTASTLGDWAAAPPVPTSAFKVVPLISGDPADVQRVFRTSGTSRGTGSRGEHHVLDLEIYRSALLPNLGAHVYGEAAWRRPDRDRPSHGDDPRFSRPDGRPSSDGAETESPREERAGLRLLALVPSPDQVPDSSLSFMLGEALDVLSAGGGGFFVRPEEGLDVEGLTLAMEEAIDGGQPVVLAGTAFAFVHWLDALTEAGRRFELPVGSRLLETGGFKGRSRVLSRAELYEALSTAHGVPTQSIVNEYGMTELLSQFYEPVLSTAPRAIEDRVHVAPPWMRTRVLDPLTLEPLPPGEKGLLCHYDLANAGSVLAVLTEDVGTVDGDGGLRVLGRVEGAEPRGCSLAMDDLLAGAR